MFLYFYFLPLEGGGLRFKIAIITFRRKEADVCSGYIINMVI